jgi:hypothetical protein
MTPDEKRAYAVELRTLAKSSQSLGAKLRQESEANEGSGENSPKKSRAPKVGKITDADYEKFMEGLEG